MGPLSNDTLSERRDGELVVMTLDRPEAANALNTVLQEAVVARLADAAADDTVRGVVLAAAGGRVFSAGADLREFADLDRAVAARRRRALLLNTLLGVLGFGKPLIAAVEGKAIGAGCMLALLCDEVIVADSCQFSFPEIRLGMASPIGMEIVAARGGRSAAHRLVQTGAALDVPALLALGLVDESVAADRLMDRALEQARALGRQAGSAYAGNKSWINAPLRDRLKRAAAEAERLFDAAPAQ